MQQTIFGKHIIIEHRARSMAPLLAILWLMVAFGQRVHAEPATFDLPGPTLRVMVTRDKLTLPLTKVPTLMAGDKLQVIAQLPKEQSAEYLIVAAFLRGPTNPPPKNWFFSCKAWKKSCVQNGLTLTVPEDAQQLLVFFAPHTGGDYKTLIDAVQGRPGAFVRAAHELNQASLDRLRLEQYLKWVRQLDDASPIVLKSAAPLLARSLAIKVDEKCLDRIPALQATCLSQAQNSLILNDGSSASMVASLTSGPASDLALQAGSTPLMNSNSFVPYIGSLLDIARLLDSFGTAHYQYIPALSMLHDDRLALMLNTPPSFHEPQSVLVTAMPVIEPARLPTLRAIDPTQHYCARNMPLVLPVDGAPLVFATQFARDLSVTVKTASGKDIELPARADARRGGIVIDDTRLLGDESPAANSKAQLHGYWGFEPFRGPEFVLVNPTTTNWSVAAGDETALVVGREDTLHIRAEDVSCVDAIRWRDEAGEEHPLSWQAVSATQLQLKVPLSDAQPGAITLLIQQFGRADPATLRVATFADAGRLDTFTMYAGDTTAVINGARLDQVERVTFKGLDFAPGELTSKAGIDSLSVSALNADAAAALNAGDSGKVVVLLKDGRKLRANAMVYASRPAAALIAKDWQRGVTEGSAQIELSSDDEVPLDARLTFSIRIKAPAKFTPDMQVEVATVDGAFSTSLSLANAGLTLQTTKVAVASFEPLRSLGASAFGKLQFRLVAHGVTGDWQSLGVLVRLPTITDIQCAADVASNCRLLGKSLYLIASIAGDAGFTRALTVPEGFPADALPVPRPVDGALFVKLRDDPETVSRIRFAQLPNATSSPTNGSTNAPVSATGIASPPSATATPQ